jgi:hypothetical protein
MILMSSMLESSCLLWGQKPRVRHLFLGLTRRAGVLADLENFLPESLMDRGEEQGLHFGWNLVKWIKEVANELANAGQVA